MPGAQIIMVDKKKLDDPPVNTRVIYAEGISWLAENFTEESEVSYIIPALPLHLAVEWLAMILPEKNLFISPYELSAELLARLPHAIRQNRSQAVISHADFICPENCMEPEKICTHTGMARPLSLYSMIGSVDFPPYFPLVLRSRQLAPGVGGFLPEDLWTLLAKVEACRAKPLLIATACKCHGIIDGLMIASL